MIKNEANQGIDDHMILVMGMESCARHLLEKYIILGIF